MHIARVGSIYATVSITIERFLSIKRQQNFENRFKSLLVGFPIFFAITYNIPRFFELETTTDNGNYDMTQVLDGQQRSNRTKESNDFNETTIAQNCTLNTTYIVEDLGYQGTEMRQNQLYIVLYIFWSKFLFIELIPWVTVFILNLLIWKSVRKFEIIRRTTLGIENGMNSNQYYL